MPNFLYKVVEKKLLLHTYVLTDAQPSEVLFEVFQNTDYSILKRTVRCCLWVLFIIFIISEGEQYKLLPTISDFNSTDTYLCVYFHSKRLVKKA